VSAHGFCSSPVLWGDLVIVNGDHDGDSYVVALDKATGEVAWKSPRRYKTRSYVTPLVREIGGRPELVFSGSKCVVGLDPRDGSTIWSIEGPTEQFVASMVDDDEKFYMAAGFPTHHVLAIRPGGTGDVTDTHVAWHSTEAKCYVPSPVVVGKYLLVADDRGTANCFDTGTGERLWQDRLGRQFHASLVAAGGLVYFVADDGLTRVVKPGPELKIVAENELGEFSYASPAIAGGRLYLRGEEHLFAIGRKALADAGK
ncbi:MAG: PQQ-like beta-propeller repeat protein, partial [Planctomycetes bacterium]|nr:PQQ-like beta-propeller repeat protein [Planctomycetota bacterium]